VVEWGQDTYNVQLLVLVAAEQCPSDLHDERVEDHDERRVEVVCSWLREF
jgi:hypothetical protein